jgi:DNA-binding CsgD family transcriptional regulator/tetratricopeptide (TPR) repeat protein
MEVSGLPPAAYVAALRDLAARRLVRVDERGVRSGHGLIREILHTAQLPAERRYLHDGYATALAHRPGDDARMAFHALAAGRPVDAVAGFSAAAEQAEDVDAYGDAWSHWQAAVASAAEAGSADAMQDQLVGRALHAAALAGEYDGGLAILDARTAVAGTAAWSHQPRGELLAALGRGEEALVEFTFAEEAGADPERAIASAADTLVRLGRYDEALARAQTALAGAPSLEVEVTAATALATAQVFLDDPGGRDPLVRTLEAAERRGDPVQAAVSGLGLATLLTGPLNDVDAGIDLAVAAATAAAAHGTARTHGVRLTAVAVEGLFRAGRWTEADTLLRRAFDQEPSGADLVTLLLARARIGVARGHFAGSREDLDRVRLLLAGSAEGHFRIPTLTLLCGLAIWEGRFEEALDHALDALAAQTSTQAWFVAPVLWHAHRAIAEARAAGKPLRVTVDVRERLVGVADTLQGAGRLRRGPVRDTIEAYAALWEAERRRHRPELAVAAWRDAGLRWERRGQPYPALYAGLHRAEALLVLDRRDAAGAGLLRECVARARSMGAEPLAAVAAEVARRAGVRWDEGGDQPETPLLASSPLARLTDRELGILRELTEGRRNREIATRLFISERTVTTHVSHILAKLQVHSRVQAAAVYHRARTTPRG